MVSTGVPSLDHLLGEDGYPDKSSILVVGPPGIGEGVLGYWFVRSGLVQGDYCLYTTHRPLADFLRDMKGMGISTALNSADSAADIPPVTRQREHAEG